MTFKTISTVKSIFEIETIQVISGKFTNSKHKEDQQNLFWDLKELFLFRVNYAIKTFLSLKMKSSARFRGQGRFSKEIFREGINREKILNL